MSPAEEETGDFYPVAGILRHQNRNPERVVIFPVSGKKGDSLFSVGSGPRAAGRLVGGAASAACGVIENMLYFLFNVSLGLFIISDVDCLM
ncbi:hypothetical protein HLH36_16405 [Gluconacetobacter aggeris]|uniref:Uncharacterized protein n=1 Tax=Gluconacetobacter aggeris TaxID=1286186 RepID=A0A7W4IW85_9PROT|nr:hypothetical protein [Gluconacetobacter aggeris]MBB2169907.1 hypothetical protein [Gluconacetobacter aggeris]